MATHQHANIPIDIDAVPTAEGLNFALVVSAWNAEITESLYQGAYKLLESKSAGSIQRIDVPGSFELIYGARKAMELKVDSVVVIGSVIRGETAHFDFVCGATAHGIKDLNVLGSVPVIFCVLTDDTWQQAQDRSGGKYGNKGTEAAIAAIKMAKI